MKGKKAENSQNFPFSFCAFCIKMRMDFIQPGSNIRKRSGSSEC